MTSTSMKTSPVTSCHSQDSSSSDEDQEEIQRLREAAISVELHTEDDRNAINQNSQEQAKPPSLRENQNKQTDYNELQTTPSFQKHMAKKLSQILDEQLEFSECLAVPDDLHSNYTGIKLLSSSKGFVELHQTTVKTCPVKKSRDNNSSSDSDSSSETAKFLEAAITYDAIKSKDQLLSAFDASIKNSEEVPKLVNPNDNDLQTKQNTKKKKVKKMKKEKD
ncbi:protein CUSTOS-like [Argonauta hians]